MSDTDKNIFHFPQPCFIKAEAFLESLLVNFQKVAGALTIDDPRQLAINVLAQTTQCKAVFWLKGSQIEKSSKQPTSRFRLFLGNWLQEHRPDENNNNTVNLIDITLPEYGAARSVWVDLSSSSTNSDESIESILFYKIKKDSWLDEGSGIMAKAFAVALGNKSPGNDPSALKFKIIDQFRNTYNYVSAAMYAQRFEHFKQELQNVEVNFEPIIHFSPAISHFNIWGVETLARKRGTDKAPVELFKAAENWGVKFQTELDLYILEKALSTFRERCNEGNFGSYSQLLNITINVYPNTLLREIYRKHLLEAIKKYRIQGDKVIVEISEKGIIFSGDSENGSLAKFNKVKNELKKHNIRFAIDDFGAGNSSILRALKLQPDYIKIDRDLLLYSPDISKRIIRELAAARYENGNKVFNIVIEGLDEVAQEKISLFELINELSIEFVQGYLFGHATKDIAFCLDEKKHIQISTLLGWQNESNGKKPVATKKKKKPKAPAKEKS